MSTFDYLSSRILTHYSDIERLDKFPPPRMMILYPTYACNAKCGYCEYKGDLGKTEMPWEMLRDVVGQAATFGVKSIELCGGGEPTLHPHFPALCQLIVDSGMKLGMLTNGWGLVYREIIPFLAEHASYVRISLDAATHTTYSKVKGLDREYFNLLMGAIQRLAVLRAESCKVSAKFLLTPDNYTEVVLMARKARALGLDSAQFKVVRGTQDLTSEQHEVARGLLALAREEVRGIRIMGDLHHPIMREKCRLCQLYTLVDADGSMYLCCYFRHRKDTHYIGSLHNEPLRTIWGGRRHREAMAGIRPEACNIFDCRFVDYHRIAQELIWEGEGQFEFL